VAPRIAPPHSADSTAALQTESPFPSPLSSFRVRECETPTIRSPLVISHRRFLQAFPRDSLESFAFPFLRSPRGRVAVIVQQTLVWFSPPQNQRIFLMTTRHSLETSARQDQMYKLLSLAFRIFLVLQPVSPFFARQAEGGCVSSFESLAFLVTDLPPGRSRHELRLYPSSFYPSLERFSSLQLDFAAPS